MKYIISWPLFISPTYSPDPRSNHLSPLLLQNLQTGFCTPSPAFLLSAFYSQHSSHTDPLQIRQSMVLLLKSLHWFPTSLRGEVNLSCDLAPHDISDLISYYPSFVRILHEPCWSPDNLSLWCYFMSRMHFLQI